VDISPKESVLIARLIGKPSIRSIGVARQSRMDGSFGDTTEAVLVRSDGSPGKSLRVQCLRQIDNRIAGLRRRASQRSLKKGIVNYQTDL
jgi:hypothetical protein